MHRSFVFGLLLMTGIGFWFCQSVLEEDTVLYPDQIIDKHPLKATLQSDSIFFFTVEEGFDYKTMEGTRISIPPDALVYEDGRRANGVVNIVFSTLKDAFDVLKTNAVIHSNQPFWEYAGGIKISVLKEGEPLLLDPSKSIELRLATYGKENNYSLFSYNAATLDWDSISFVKPVINEEHAALDRKIYLSDPVLKFPLSSAYMAFSYKGILDVFYGDQLVNVNHHQVAQKMEQYGLRWMDIQVEDFIFHKKQQEFAAGILWKNISKKAFPKWTIKQNGRLQKIKKNRYRLTVADPASGKKFSTQVEAVMPLSHLFDYGPGFWKKDYDLRLKSLDLAISQLEQMPDSYRTFKVNQFGLYVFRKPVEELESVNLGVYFKNEFMKAENAGFYFATRDRKIAKYYRSGTNHKIPLLKDVDASLFTLYQDSIWEITPEDWLAIDFDKLEQMHEPSLLLTLKQGASVKGLKD